MDFATAFFTLYRRRPDVFEAEDAYILAQVRRAYPAVVLTEKQKASSDVLMVFPRIESQGQTWLGGDQGWLARKAQRVAGCGPVAGANTLACYAARNENAAQALGLHYLPDGRIQKKEYTAFMQRVYETIGTMEIPIWRDVAERSDNPALPLPASLGRDGAGFESGVLRHAAKCGIQLVSRRLLTSYVSAGEAWRFLQAGLQSGCPVTLLTLWNGHALYVYHDGYDKAPKRWEKPMRSHFVTIVGTRKNKVSGAKELIVSSWGKVCVIDFAALHKSWQSPKSLATAMFYFTKTSNADMTRRHMVSAYGMLPASLVKTAWGFVKKPFLRE